MILVLTLTWYLKVSILFNRKDAENKSLGQPNFAQSADKRHQNIWPTHNLTAFQALW